MRILVAEDDAPFAEFLQERLQQEQFAVQIVADGREAQQLATNQSYDLVILDLDLPGIGGLDVLRSIRSKKPDLPVLIVTGAGMVEERVQGLDAGADDYLANRLLSRNWRRASALSCGGEAGRRPQSFALMIWWSTE